jgi:DNA-binding beta-propeller fold protein YncE
MVNLRTGVITTVAGNGEKGIPRDGAMAIESPLVDPRAVAVDKSNNVYALERSGHALRVVDSAGKIRTVVGTGKAGSSGDDGDARKAMLNGPKHLCFDAAGNVIIADTENHAIRKYLAREGKIMRLAGNGRKGKAGVGGPPLEVELNQPHGVYLHRDGTLYIADSSNHRVLKIIAE